MERSVSIPTVEICYINRNATLSATNYKRSQGQIQPVIAVEITDEQIASVIAVGNLRRGLKRPVAVPQEDSAAAVSRRCVTHASDHIGLVVRIEISHDDRDHRTAATQGNGLRRLKRAVSPAQNCAQSFGTLVTNDGIEFL